MTKLLICGACKKAQRGLLYCIIQVPKEFGICLDCFEIWDAIQYRIELENEFRHSSV